MIINEGNYLWYHSSSKLFKVDYSILNLSQIRTESMHYLYLFKFAKSIRESSFLFANLVPLTTNIFIVYLVWNHLSVNITDSFCYNLWGLFFRASKNVVGFFQKKTFNANVFLVEGKDRELIQKTKLIFFLKKNVSFFRCEVNKLWTGKRLLIYKKTTMRLI